MHRFGYHNKIQPSSNSKIAWLLPLSFYQSGPARPAQPSAAEPQKRKQREQSKKGIMKEEKPQKAPESMYQSDPKT